MSRIFGALALLALSACVAVHHSSVSADGSGTTVNGLVRPSSANTTVLGEHALDIAATTGVPVSVSGDGVHVQVGGRYVLQPGVGGVIDPAAFWTVQNSLGSREAALSARSTPPVVVIGGTDPALAGRVDDLEQNVSVLFDLTAAEE
jgi:hypothetical protein